jgi:DNA-nicking Smr family endonuclease
MFAELKKLWRRWQRARAAETAAEHPAAPAAGGRSPQPAAAQKRKHPAPVVLPPSPPAVSPPKTARAMPPEKAACARVNRHGLPILKGDEDLFLLFSRAGGSRQAPNRRPRRQLPDPRSNPAAGSPVAEAAKDNPSGSAPQRDRHGLPVLAAEADLETLFGVQPDPPAPPRGHPAAPVPPPFGRLVQRSLAEGDLQLLLEEKIRQERRGAQKMSIRQQIKSHPLPQRQLDLHGCTAVQAEQRTEAFVRGALHAGLVTVRIIVGKGLHSQGRAVLPDAVAEKLSELKRRGQVLTFQWEKHTKSKSGALIVYL